MLQTVPIQIQRCARDDTALLSHITETEHSLKLVDGALREDRDPRLQIDLAKGLFVLGQVLPQDVPQRLGLLRAEEGGLVVADVDLVGALAAGQTEDQLKIPHADAHLHTIGVALAVVGGLDKIQLRLLCG